MTEINQLSEQSAPADTPSPDTSQTPTDPDQPPVSPLSSELPESSALPAASPEAGTALPESLSVPHEEAITWTASEFVAHEKSIGWYALFGLAAAALAVVAYLITRGILSTVVVLVGALVLGAYGSRQPRQLQYKLDRSGLEIGPRRYTYSSFRSFAIVPEGAFSSIIFLPLKRFAPLTTVYYAPEDEPKILSMLSTALPLEEFRHDVVDQLMRRIRF